MAISATASQIQTYFQAKFLQILATKGLKVVEIWAVIGLKGLGSVIPPWSHPVFTLVRRTPLRRWAERAKGIQQMSQGTWTSG